MSDSAHGEIVRLIKDFLEDKHPHKGAVMVRMDDKGRPQGVVVASATEDVGLMIITAVAIYAVGLRRTGMPEDKIRSACGEIGEHIFKHAYDLSTKVTPGEGG